MKLKHKIIHLSKKILGRDYGWSGNYKTWQEAKRHCEGYNTSTILDKVKDATLKVKNGEAVYERDSVLFNEIDYSHPLLHSLQAISEERGSSLKIVDFGGSLGSSYFQNRIHFTNLKNLEWSVVEQKNFVDTGNELIADEHLSFFYTIKEAIDKKGNHDVLLLSCVLPYLEAPYDLLSEVRDLNFKYIIIDNTYFNNKPQDRLTVQRVRPHIYTASYPAWFLDYRKVLSTLLKNYEVIREHTNESFLYLDDETIQYRGVIVKSKNNERNH